MVSVFKSKSPAVVFQLIVLSIIMHLHFFVKPPVVIVPPANTLMYYILHPLENLPSLILSLLYHVIVVMQALRLNYLLNQYRLFPTSGYTAAMCYILFTSLLPAWTNISDALVVNFLLLLLMHFCMRLTTTQHPISALFNCGILSGISVLLYPPISIIIILALIAILIIRSLRINELFVYLAGAIIPLYLLAGILFLYNKLEWLKNLLPVLSFHLTLLPDKISFFITLILTGICVIAGFIAMQNNFGKLLISARKLWIIIILSLIFLIGSIFLSADNYRLQTMLITLPACAAIASNLFYYSRNKMILALLFWLIVAIGLFNSFGGVALIKK
ncbi:MAG: DUF6427 family protein [Arachidicoccus sp.]|nr:DUF6427 family protein [Arachidicoccus sp.]